MKISSLKAYHLEIECLEIWLRHLPMNGVYSSAIKIIRTHSSNQSSNQLAFSEGFWVRKMLWYYCRIPYSLNNGVLTLLSLTSELSKAEKLFRDEKLSVKELRDLSKGTWLVGRSRVHHPSFLVFYQLSFSTPLPGLQLKSIQ